MNQGIEVLKQRAQQAGMGFGTFVGYLLKDILMGLGLVFGAILIFGAL
jgi:hypothetical protein